jgi:hypothetical protein
LRWIDLAAAHAWALTVLAGLAWLARRNLIAATLISSTLISARRKRAVLLGECER